jgi:hypothetical protein
MRKSDRKTVGAAAAALFFLAVLGGAIFASDVVFTGKVVRLDKENLSLEKKFERAFSEFKKEKKRDAYFTGYIFQCRHDLRFGEKGTSDSYKISVDGRNLKVRRTEKEEFSSSSRSSEESSPVGVVFLHDGQNGRIVDICQIDVEKTYTVEEYPLYWFGEADNDESFRFFQAQFEKAEDQEMDELIFFIGSHIHPDACDFLRDVALGSYPSKARESAIFWLGSNKYEDSLAFLKEIFQKEDSPKIREKVVFSLYLLGDETAVKELIRIAKRDESSEVRKQAIFWLGQKASEESVKALKGVVDDTHEETSVKESAVFAISQLPKEKSVPLLIQVARSNKNPKVRENAIFWLGQKDSEEALKFFEEILLKKK